MDSQTTARPRSPQEWGLTLPIYRRTEAFKILGVGHSRGHEMMNDGTLEVVKIGASSNITATSIAAVLNKGLIGKAENTAEEVSA